MGLDSYWKGTDQSAPSIEPPLNLCGGMCSGHGDESFRGKVYNSLIEQVTGVSLYQRMIPNSDIKIMATKLREFLENNKDRIIVTDTWQLEPKQMEDLVRMFEYHAQYNSDLYGWW